MLSKKKILIIIKISFISFICVLLYKMLDWKQVSETFLNVSIVYFVIVFSVHMGDKIIMGLKWNILLKLYNVNVPCYVPIIAYLKGRIFPIFTPSNIGIDVYKAYYLKKYNNSLSNIVSSIFIERFIGMLSSLAMISLMLPFAINLFDIPYKKTFVVLGYLLFFIITVFIIYIIPKGKNIKLKRHLKFLPVSSYEKINKFFFSLSLIKEKRAYILIYYFASIAEKALYGIAIYFCTRSLGLAEIDIMFIVAAAPLVSLLERLPISFSALGLREGLIVFLLKPYIKSSDISFSVSLVLRLAELLSILPSLILWIKRDPYNKYNDEIQSVTKGMSYIKKSA